MKKVLSVYIHSMTTVHLSLSAQVAKSTLFMKYLVAKKMNVHYSYNTYRQTVCMIVYFKIQKYVLKNTMYLINRIDQEGSYIFLGIDTTRRIQDR